MNNIIEFIQSNFAVFDVVAILITIYAMAQCTARGFTLSLLSFSKWLIALVITIVLVPKISPWVRDYIESEFVADIGLGIFVFIISLFIIINISKAISSAISWSGLGLVDKTFGMFFGIFKGYLVCVCLFSFLNWFYPHEKWSVKTEDAYSFDVIYKGSEFLIKGLPNSQDYYDKTEEKMKKI